MQTWWKFHLNECFVCFTDVMKNLENEQHKQSRKLDPEVIKLWEASNHFDEVQKQNVSVKSRSTVGKISPNQPVVQQPTGTKLHFWINDIYYITQMENTLNAFLHFFFFLLLTWVTAATCAQTSAFHIHYTAKSHCIRYLHFLLPLGLNIFVHRYPPPQKKNAVQCWLDLF